MLLGHTLAVAAVTLAAVQPPAEDETPAPKDVVETAVGAKKFTALVKAIQAADLTDTLKGTGPFTLFAPTDDAFKAFAKTIGAEKYQALLADKGRLKKLLMGHVVPDKAMTAEDVTNLDGKKVNDFAIKVKGEKTMIGEAKVAKAGIQCKNGVIHVIDKVLVAEK